MDIREISQKTGVSLRSLKKLEKSGYLNADTIDPIIEKARTNLRRGKPLTAEQLLYLVKVPKKLERLLDFKDDARHHLDQLGDAVGERMPWQISSYALSAASKDMEAVNQLAEWFCDFIDRNPAFANGATHDHAFLAVRMLADIPDRLLHQTLPVAQRVMWNCRHTKRMAGYWHSDPKTRRTLYHRPATFFDL